MDPLFLNLSLPQQAVAATSTPPVANQVNGLPQESKLATYISVSCDCFAAFCMSITENVYINYKSICLQTFEPLYLHTFISAPIALNNHSQAALITLHPVLQ